MAGRYDSNPFDVEDEVNPFSVSWCTLSCSKIVLDL